MRTSSSAHARARGLLRSGAAGLLAAFPLVASCAPASDPGDPALEAVSSAARPETLALPDLEMGMSAGAIAAALPGVAPRPVSGGVEGWESWEWSEPMGRYALAHFRGGRLVAGMVRRPWDAGLPLVEADRLVGLDPSLSRREVEARLGTGWPVARAVLTMPGLDPGLHTTERHAWSIRDHGRDTGFTLFVTFAGDRTLIIEHPWVGR